MRPLMLDLFCGAGGAAMGYWRAGFDVVGVDIEPQPNYPFEFVQADALAPPFELSEFAAIHASPPCQHWSSATRDRTRHPDVIAPTRELLEASGRPYIIENVEGAPLIGYLRLCGSMFGLQIQRHRYFELSFAAWSPGGCNHKAWTAGRPWTITGNLRGVGYRLAHSFKPSLADAKALMGMPWAETDHEVSEAIPPSYCEWIGTQLLAQLQIPANSQEDRG